MESGSSATMTSAAATTLANPNVGSINRSTGAIPESPSKPSNPKDLIGSDKLPLNLVPTVTIAYGTLGHLEGHLKYGLVNWREAGVRASIYLDAMKRHMQKFADAGEWADPVTKVPHLGSIIACCGIILDAYHAGKLIDDRPKPNPAVGQLIDDLGETVRHLKQLFADKNPIHYTISGPVCRSESTNAQVVGSESSASSTRLTPRSLSARESENMAEIPEECNGW